MTGLLTFWYESCPRTSNIVNTDFLAQDHYIGVDVGTGSARACIIDETGDIKALASQEIKLWQPETGYYEQSTTNIWHCICDCVRRVVTESAVDPNKIKGIGFDATCSLAVFNTETDEPVTVTGPDFENDGNDRNVILWLDHRPVEETDKINNTGHNLLKYVGGRMSIEMEMPKTLWLKNNMPADKFDKCKFYDLTDALTHLATGGETRSFCSTVCKQGYVPIGVDGSEKGWQEDFFNQIGLGDLAKNNFERMGGVHGVVSSQSFPPSTCLRPLVFVGCFRCGSRGSTCTSRPSTDFPASGEQGRERIESRPPKAGAMSTRQNIC